MKPLLLSIAANILLWVNFSVGARSFNPWRWDETERWVFVGFCLFAWAGFFMADKIGRDVERWEREEKEEKAKK